jgi:hypothetical protein
MKSILETVESGFREMGLVKVEMHARVYLHFDARAQLAEVSTLY